MTCIKLKGMCMENIFPIVSCICIQILPAQNDRIGTQYFFIKVIPIIMPWVWKLCHRFGTGLISRRTICSTNYGWSAIQIWSLCCCTFIFNNIWQQTLDLRSRLNSWNAYCCSLPEYFIFLSFKIIITRIYKTIILSVVLYGYETVSLNLREGCRTGCWMVYLNSEERN
jgi:hypothetical protein